jgi:hypothetical protein
MPPRRFESLLAVLFSAMALGQSNPLPFINQNGGVLAPASAFPTGPKTRAKILDQYGKLPLSFEANRGQTDTRVKFLSRMGGYTLFLTGDEAVLALRGSKPYTNNAKIADVAHPLKSGMAGPKDGGVLRMKLRNVRPAAKVTGLDELVGTIIPLFSTLRRASDNFLAKL